MGLSLDRAHQVAVWVIRERYTYTLQLRIVKIKAQRLSRSNMRNRLVSAYSNFKPTNI